MKNFNLKNYGIDDLSKEPFEIKKINLPSYNDNYFYDENKVLQHKVHNIKRYIIIDKETN